MTKKKTNLFGIAAIAMLLVGSFFLFTACGDPNNDRTAPDTQEFTITLTQSAGGTISSSHTRAVAGTNITITALPDNDYELINVSIIFGGVTMPLHGTGNTREFPMPSANVEVISGFLSNIGPFTIISPYRNVNWATFGSFRAATHSHTNRSDGQRNLSAVIEEHFRQGFDILAITDHNITNFDWTTGGFSVWSGAADLTDVPLTQARYDEIRTGVGREGRGMLRIPYANEQSRGQHVNTYNANFNNQPGWSMEQSIREAHRLGGISRINHPGRYIDRGDISQAAWLDKAFNLFMDYPSLVGFEIVNQNDRHPTDRRLWDNLLARTVPMGRLLWAFADDDSHNHGHINRNWNTFVMESNTVPNFLSAMTAGNFYAVSTVARPELGGAFIPSGDAPSISSIVVNDREGTITINANNATRIDWISGVDNIVFTSTGGTSTIVLPNHFNEDLTAGTYVRANILGPGGIAFTQPFGIFPRTIDTTPVVTSVRVTPELISLEVGSGYQFTARVTGSNNPAQTVNWAVEGGLIGTTISNTGLLSIYAGETAEILTVRATSTVDTTQYGTSMVAVTNVLAEGYLLRLNLNALPFTAFERGDDIRGVGGWGTMGTWAASGPRSFTLGEHTLDSTRNVLEIANTSSGSWVHIGLLGYGIRPNTGRYILSFDVESNPDDMTRAAWEIGFGPGGPSASPTQNFRTSIRFFSYNDGYLEGRPDRNRNFEVTVDTHGNDPEGGTVGTILVDFLPSPRWHRVTAIIDTDTTPPTATWTIQDNEGSFVNRGGSAGLTRDFIFTVPLTSLFIQSPGNAPGNPILRVDNLRVFIGDNEPNPPAFFPHQPPVQVTVDEVRVTPAEITVLIGQSWQFNAAVTGTNNPAQTVDWTVEGGLPDTTISNTGLLTIYANETATTLTVRATSTVDPIQHGTATVTVTAVHVPQYILHFDLHASPYTGPGQNLLPSPPAAGSVGIGGWIQRGTWNDTLRHFRLVEHPLVPGRNVFQLSNTTSGSWMEIPLSGGGIRPNSGKYTFSFDVQTNPDASTRAGWDIGFGTGPALQTQRTSIRFFAFNDGEAETPPNAGRNRNFQVTVDTHGGGANEGDVFGAIVVNYMPAGRWHRVTAIIDTDTNTAVWTVQDNAGSFVNVNGAAGFTQPFVFSAPLTVLYIQAPGNAPGNTILRVDNLRVFTSDVEPNPPAFFPTQPPLQTTVDTVRVNPSEVTILRGTTREFNAVVTGINNPPTTVTWGVTGGTGTTDISSTGLLTVDANQPVGTLIVTATSTFDPTKYGTATVNVIDGFVAEYIFNINLNAPPYTVPGQDIRGVGGWTSVGTWNTDNLHFRLVEHPLVPGRNVIQASNTTSGARQFIRLDGENAIRPNTGKYLFSFDVERNPDPAMNTRASWEIGFATGTAAGDRHQATTIRIFSPNTQAGGQHRTGQVTVQHAAGSDGESVGTPLVSLLPSQRWHRITAIINSDTQMATWFIQDAADNFINIGGSAGVTVNFPITAALTHFYLQSPGNTPGNAIIRLDNLRVFTSDVEPNPPAFFPFQP